MNQALKVSESLRTSVFSTKWLDIPQHEMEGFHGNKTLESVANPIFYKAIMEEAMHLAGKHREFTIANFGAGALRIESDLLFQTLSYLDKDSLAHFRKLNMHFLALEKSPILLKEGLREIVKKHGRDVPVKGIIHDAQQFRLIMPNESLDMAISRMLLMTMHMESLILHITDAMRLLKKGAKYISVVLNPEYQAALLKQVRPAGFQVQSKMLFQFPIGDSENNINASFVYYTEDDYLTAFQHADFSSVTIEKMGMTEKSVHPMFLMITAIK